MSEERDLWGFTLLAVLLNCQVTSRQPVLLAKSDEKPIVAWLQLQSYCLLSIE